MTDAAAAARAPDRNPQRVTKSTGKKDRPNRIAPARLLAKALAS